MKREYNSLRLRVVGRVRRSVEPLARTVRAGAAALGTPLFVCILLLAAYTLLAGLRREPTNYDSLTYHIARTTYWIQHRSVEFYTTAIDRQLYQPPFSEYLITLIRLFIPGDRLIFLVQWLPYIGCIALAYHIAKRLGGSGRMAAAVAATIPIAILESASVQNDLTVAFFCMAVVYFILEDKPLYAGASIGLALLTKGTAYIYLAPVVLWFTWRMARQRQFASLIAAGCIALSLNAPFYLRNMAEYGSPLGARQDGYFNDELSPRVLLSSLARNAGLNVPMDAVGFTRRLGLDPADKGISFGGYEDGQGVTYLSDSSTANPLHLALVVAALPLMLTNRRTRGLALVLVGSTLFFCLLLKFQPWHTRLHLPLLMLFAAPAAAAYPRWMHRVLVFPLLVYALLFVPFFNDERPVQSWFKPLQYRSYNLPYYEFARRMRESGCKVIRFEVEGDEPEYVLHRLLPDATFTHDPDAPACGVMRPWNE